MSWVLRQAPQYKPVSKNDRKLIQTDSLGPLN